MISIYKITNKLNNKVYVGRTEQVPEIRWKQHITGMGFGKKMPIHLALKKYGPDNFTFEVVYNCFKKEDSGFAELYFINYFNCLAPNGYNVDFQSMYIKDNPYLTDEEKKSSEVQSIESEPEINSEYNLSTRTRYPIELWKTIKTLYDEGKSPKDIKNILKINIPNRTLVGKLKALGCNTSNKARNKFRGNNKFFISDSEKLSIVEDFNRGLKTTQLEKKYKRANQAIRKILVQAGVYKSLDKKICRTAE